MVKTLPTIERSTKIRFGKNVQEDQGENTIVLNASNTVVDASDAGAVYITPVRNFPGYVGKPEVVLMMYNTTTKELTESGESAQDIIGNVGLDEVANQGNATSNTVIFNNNTTAIVTTGKVGIANSQPGHTLSIGSNVYIDDVGPSNVLVVTGGVSIDGNLAVNGGITTITTENLVIKDAIIELGKNNTSEDTTLDLGLIMTRPGSNVTVGFKEVENEMVLAYTQSSAYSNTITPIVSEDLDVHVYGGVLTESNVGIKTTSPDAELHVVGNVYVSSNLTVDGDTLHVDVENDSVGINTKNPDAELHVVGNVYVSSNLTVDTDTFHVDVENKSVGIETKNPDANLHVVGNVYVSSNLTVDTDTFHVDVESENVGINTKNPTSDLHVVGNAYVSSTTNSTTTTTGALIIAGGIGVAGQIYGQHANLEDVEADDVTITDTTTSSSDTTGALKVAGGISTQENLNVGAVAKVLSTTDATSKTTGALIVTGGLGVSKNIHGKDVFVEDVVSNSVVILDTTTSTSVTTGALKVAGGISTQENLSVGGDVLVVDTTAGSAAGPEVELFRNITGADGNYLGQVKFQGNNDADAQKNYAKITGKIGDASDGTEDGLIEFATIKAGSQSIRARLTSTNLKLLNDAGIEVDGTADITNTTGSTSTTTGALKVAGGISTQEKLNVGGITKIWDATDASSKTTGAVQIVGGLGVSKNIHGKDVFVEDVVSNSVVILDTTTSTSVTTGALKVAGGISTQKNLNVGSNAHISSNLEVGTANLFVNTLTSNVGIGTKTPSELLDIAAVSGDHDAFIRLRSGSGGSPVTESGIKLTESTRYGWRIAHNANTDSLKIAHQDQNDAINGDNYMVFKSNGNIGIAEADPTSKLQVAGDVNITDTTDASSKTTGALIVAGGVGISGALFGASANLEDVEADNLTITDSTTSTSKTTGAVTIAGGLGVSGPLFGAAATLDGITHITNTTQAGNQTTGALKVAGGLGVGGNVHCGHLTVSGNLTVTGNTTIINANNLVVKDPIIEIGKDNLTGLDTGILMNNPLTDGNKGNVAVIYDFSSSNLEIGHTLSSANNSPVVMNTANTLAVNINGTLGVTGATESSSKTTGAVTIGGGLGVYGNVHSSNIFAGYDLDLTSYMGRAAVGFMGQTNHASFAHIDNNTTVNYAIKQTEGGTTHLNAKAGQHIRLNINNSEKARLTGDGDFFVDTDTLYVDAGNDRVGVNKAAPAYTLDVVGVVGDINSSAMVKGVTFTGTNLYGTLAGSNTVAASDITASGTVKGVTFTGTNLYGTLAGSNTVAASDITASGTVKGATLTGTNLYGTLAGSNTVAASDITASGTVKGATLTGTNVYGTLAGSNTAAVTTLTASGMVKGATISGTNVYGTLAGSNTVAASDITASGTVKGATLTGTNLYGTLAGSNTAAVSDLTASAMVKGATITGTNLYGTLAGSNAAAMTTLSASGVVTLTDTTEATSSATGALKAAGGVGIAKDVYVGERAYVTGGLITNTGQVTKKTYSFTGALDNGQTIANSTIKITFSAHVFYAKIVAHLIESDDEVSTLSMECGGGHRTGGTPLTIAKGPTSVFGSASTNPWNIAVAATTTTVAFAPTTDMAAAGNYNIFIEYISAHASGAVTKITEGSTDVITFGY